MLEPIDVPSGYRELLEEIAGRIARSQIRAALAVSHEFVLLYWSIGAEILLRQKLEGRWRDPKTREPLETFTIISTEANELVAPTDLARLPLDLLSPYSAEDVRAWKVDTRVDNVQNDDPTLLANFDAPIEGLFG